MEFLTKNRVIGTKSTLVNVTLEAIAFDPDVKSEEFKFTGITYDWSCVNLGLETSCKYDS